MKLKVLKSALVAGASLVALTTGAAAAAFNIPAGDLKTALDAYSEQTGVALVVSDDAIRGARTNGAKGDFTALAALSRILDGTGLSPHRTPYGAVAVVHENGTGGPATFLQHQSTHLADATPARAAASVETVVVTSSKIKGDIQTVPIAITALSQEQLTARQIAGGPDLVKEVPNLTFSKTNFTGYNIQIRGIGTQAISVATDPAVAVAFNDTPFIRNHFFEQEFFDVAQVEVLRGPQGTLYGRNATAGVVNVVSAKPTDQFEAMLSADWGNYSNRRYEGMVNLPIVGDKLALRVAGEWTKRDGYSFNETTNAPIDGRDLWSARATLQWKPVESVTADFIWEHFSENDDRLRSGKQLCKTDPGPSTFTSADGKSVSVPPARGTVFDLSAAYFSQGCLPSSLYSKDAFEVPNGFSLPFVSGAAFEGLIDTNIDPYAQTTQSTNLRDIQSAIEPKYLAKNDTLEFNASWNVTPALTLSSDTGYNDDFLWSSEDYNRFDTSPGIFVQRGDGRHTIDSDGVFCDPQLGCSDRLVVQDLATEHAWQLSQEFRFASSFSGPFNFSAGGNYLHYETWENYYVFSNTFTLISLDNVGCNRVYAPGITDDLYCLNNGKSYRPSIFSGGIPTESPQYIDPNPITRLNNEGHNYFVSQNPYILNSYAGFGEAYYAVTDELKLTAGVRWTDDEKHFTDIPSELVSEGWGYPRLGSVDQAWHEWTGRFVANWSPKLSFTDQSMFYASYGRGYKAGGANPPGPVLVNADVGSISVDGSEVQANIAFPVHPLTFKPEFIDAYEVGTKNTLLDGGLTLNGDVFFYNYKGYQISQIVDRSSINLNFDATVKGAEIEATYEPLPGLKFSFAGGYEDTNINKNQYAIDLMDRTAGTPGWVVMKPSVGQSSNCIFPEYVAAALIVHYADNGEGNAGAAACGYAYAAGVDPVTAKPYSETTYPITLSHSGYPTISYPGFDPLSVDSHVNSATVNNGLGLPPNNGEGFAKNVGGNELPNAPHYTVSLTGDYTMPVSANWAATLHGDFYWQSQSFARVFNDRPYDKIRGYSTTNAALILTDASGWQVMGYVKNIFNVTAITGDFLNSDDSGLTTNIFLTDPRLYGVRITKNFESGSSDSFDLFSNSDGKRPQIWLTLGGSYNILSDDQQPYAPAFESIMPAGLPTPVQLQKNPRAGFDTEASISYQPEDSDWVLKAGIRYGRSVVHRHVHKSLPVPTRPGFDFYIYGTNYYINCDSFDQKYGYRPNQCTGVDHEFIESKTSSSEKHAILDFMLGKDVGIGLLGNDAVSTIGAGVRVAQFQSRSGLSINSDPLYYFPVHGQKFHLVYNVAGEEETRFRGIGPEIAWDASQPLLGNKADGLIALDWGVNAGVLFGRQRMNEHHQTTKCRVEGYGLAVCTATTVYAPQQLSRSRRITVPNFGGYAGLSVRYNNAKINLGYRADEFFGAMDGGQIRPTKENRGFYGPYLNLSVGFGG